MNKKEIIKDLIKRLEEIKDTAEIDEVIIEPFHIVEEAKFVDGTIVGTASQIIEIRYTKMFKKKSEFAEWEQTK